MRCKGYIAEEVFPEPIVPVINMFWYNPFSGIKIGSLLIVPTNKFKSSVLILCFFNNFFSCIGNFKWLKILLYKIKYEIIKEIIEYFFNKLQVSGYTKAISKGLIA